jgi:hypothetical protein
MHHEPEPQKSNLIGGKLEKASPSSSAGGYLGIGALKVAAAVYIKSCPDAKTNLRITKTKTALKHWQETYNHYDHLSDLKLEHDPHCEFVDSEL